MSKMNIQLRKWVKKYIKQHFNDDIERELNDERGATERQELEENERKIVSQSVVNRMMKTREIDEIIKALRRMKNSMDSNEENMEKNVNLNNIEENLQSYESDDLTSENWCPLLMESRMEGNNLSIIFNEIAMDKPVHVRLGGFETLFESDLTNNCNSDGFEQLLTLLKDGIADMTKSIFEASLRIHSKLLDSPRSHDVYTNLINAFNAEYYSEKYHQSLPNFATGINFKIFIHEKLMRILYVIVKYHKEILKMTRTVDRTMEEMIDQFVILLTHNNENKENKESTHCKRLSALNLVSILEPYADWSTKWIYSVGTRKTFTTAVSKSSSLLNIIWNIVKKGLEQTTFNGALAYSIKDDTIQSMYRSVYISGDTVETITYLHCLNFISQINNCLNDISASISLDSSTDLPVSSIDFLLALVKSLNSLATTTTPKTIYNISQHALKIILNQPTYSFHSHIGQIALIPLCNSIGESNGNLWPHTIDMINFMLDSNDGLIFLTSPYQSCIFTDNSSPIPASNLINYTSNLLRQPIAVMNVDHVVQILEFMGKLFCIIENFNGAIYEPLENQLYPSVEYLNNKIQKFSIRQENKCQLLDSALKDMLLKIVAWPFGLKLLPQYPVTFEELIRASINPFRHSWSSNEIISFITAVTYFDQGCKLMVDLVPHTISMLLDEIYNNMENDENLVHLQEDCKHVEKFTHVLSLFSLNTKCFLIFMMEEDSTDESDSPSDPRNLTQLFKHTVIFNSPFHHLSLLALETVIWNLDILIYLLNSYNLQTKLLELQDCCLLEVTKHKDESNDDENEEFSNGEIQSEESKIEEMHNVYLIDETSLLRNRILSKSYFIRHKLEKLLNNQIPEKCIIYSSFPPPTSDNNELLFLSTSECAQSQLDEFLQDCKPGLRDSGWVMQVRNAYEKSPGQMKHSTYFNLLNQMERATAAVEWIDMFKWKNSQSSPIIYEWLPEEIIGLELIIRFAEDHWEIPDNKSNVEDNLKEIFESIHTFIKYPKGKYFQVFDWFLGTVFIICDGNLDRCKKFIKNLVRFPSAIYMWHIHGISHDATNDGQTLGTQFILAQQIDYIVTQEFPALKHAMTNECGIKWWMICNRFLSQCFWGILEWSEIIHFLTICILYPPDQIVYYFVSLLQHCEEKIMQDIVNKKYWPENIDLSSYQCHNYIAYMDRLAKKYQNHILPSLNQNKSTTLNDAE